MNSPSLELHELGGQFSSRERFQLFSGETNFSRKFRKLWFSANTPLQTIITQATFVTIDHEKLLTIGRNYISEHQGKQSRFMFDEELVRKIIPEAIAHTRNIRKYYAASLEGEAIYNRKSPHFLVLFQLFENETRTAQQILDELHKWQENPQSAEPWQVALSDGVNHSLKAIKRQLEDGVRQQENASAPIVERVRKGVYRLIKDKRDRVEWWLCCLEIFLDWRYSCQQTGMKLPRVGYRFFVSYQYDPGTGKYVKSPYADEYDQSLMKAPYNTDAFYWEHPQFKQGTYDQYDHDHVKVGEEQFFHGEASRHRIANQQKARRTEAKPQGGNPEGRRL